METRTDISAVLAQMRQVRSQIQSVPDISKDIKPQDIKQVEKSPPAFGELFSNAIDGVNDLQQNAASLRTSYELGDDTIDITRVMVESQKASISFQALTQVRNKMVQAYEEIMKMPV